jgi:hypothetical protein
MRYVADPDEPRDDYALKVAHESFTWYRSAAIRSRRLYRTSEVAVILLSALIPLSVAVLPGVSLVPAALGSVVAVVGGAKAVFHWQENYIRFTRSREAVEAERRRFIVGSGEYSQTAVRAGVLVDAITRIEQEEMGDWIKIAAPSQRPSGQSSGDS